MGIKGLKIQEKAANGFHRWPFSQDCKPSQVARSGCGGPWTPVLPCGCWGEGGWPALGGARPLGHPQETAWGRGWGAAVWPWFQQEAWKKSKMRSLQSGRVGCDTGEERGVWRNKELL